MSEPPRYIDDKNLLGKLFELKTYLPYKDPDVYKEYQKQYQKENRKQIQEQRKKWRQIPEVKARLKEYKQTASYKEMKKISDKKWRERNKERKRMMDKEYRQKNPEVKLKSDIKSLEKYAIPFKLSYKKYKWALQSWSKICRKRDNNECQICGSTNRLHTHHIFKKSNYPRLALNVNNGITLCTLHHHQVHGIKLNSYVEVV